jgi:glycosyltransferase involved in cell wall biosynthesis
MSSHCLWPWDSLSARAQAYPPAEIIVSDDASQDNSCDVVASYISRGYGIRLLRNPHSGMAANLNAAYQSSCGDLICLLDADDTFLPGKIEAVVKAFLAHPAAGFAIHRASLSGWNRSTTSKRSIRSLARHSPASSAIRFISR